MSAVHLCLEVEDIMNHIGRFPYRVGALCTELTHSVPSWRTLYRVVALCTELAHTVPSWRTRIELAYSVPSCRTLYRVGALCTELTPSVPSWRTRIELAKKIYNKMPAMHLAWVKNAVGKDINR